VDAKLAEVAGNANLANTVRVGAIQRKQAQPSNGTEI
jgi:hypothetical protein